MYQKYIRNYIATKRGKASSNTRSTRRITTTARERYLKALRVWKKALEEQNRTREG